MPTIRNRVREERMKQQMSQEDLANRVGCARGTINQIENHRRDPSPDVMLKIAQALKMPVEHLFEVADGRALAWVGRSARYVASVIAVLAVLWLSAAGSLSVAGSLGYGDSSRAMLQVSEVLLHPIRTLQVNDALTSMREPGVYAMIFPSPLQSQQIAKWAPTEGDCQSWLHRFGTLVDRFSQGNEVLPELYRLRANCLDVLGYQRAALADRESYVASEFAMRGRVLTFMAYASIAKGDLYLFAARDSIQHEDTWAARILLERAFSTSDIAKTDVAGTEMAGLLGSLRHLMSQKEVQSGLALQKCLSGIPEFDMDPFAHRKAAWVHCHVLI